MKFIFTYITVTELQFLITQQFSDTFIWRFVFFLVGVFPRSSSLVSEISFARKSCLCPHCTDCTTINVNDEPSDRMGPILLS